MSPETRAALGLGPSDLTPSDLTPSDLTPSRVPSANPTSVAPRAGAGLAVALRVQRRMALRTMSLLVGGLILLPVVLANTAVLQRARLVGIPILWLVLGGALYPALLLLASHHRRGVDRLEAALAHRQASGPA